MLPRRGFIKLSGASKVAVLAMRHMVLRIQAAIPGGTLDPASVSKFVTPLLIPQGMPTAGTLKLKGGKNADYY